MGEMRRYCFVTNPAPHIPHVQETNKGEWVRVTDHERVVAEKDARIKRAEGTVEYFRKQVGDLKHEGVKRDARIKELEGIVSGKTMFDAAEAERERVKARVEAVRADAPAWPDDDSYEAGLDAALAAIDKEGEGEVNTTEEEGDRG